MKSETLGNALLAGALVAVGAVAWWLQLRPGLAVDAEPLSSLPPRVAQWRAVDVPMAPSVERILRADFHVQRTYVRTGAAPIWLYIGYYGTERGGRPEHTPRNCYVSADWGIEQARVVEIDGALRVNEYLIERRGEQRLVQFWYRSHRRSGLLGGFDQSLDRLLGRLLHDRADGALVRVSMPVDEESLPLARRQLLRFSASLDGLLEQHWPLERPRAESG